MSWSMPQLRLRWLPSKRILVFSRCISTRGRRWIAHYELNTWEMISSTQIYAKFACKSSVAHHCWRWYLAIDDAEDRFSNQGVYDEKIQEFQQNVRRDCPLYKQLWWQVNWDLRIETWELSTEWRIVSKCNHLIKTVFLHLTYFFTDDSQKIFFFVFQDFSTQFSFRGKNTEMKNKKQKSIWRLRPCALTLMRWRFLVGQL